MKEFFVSFVSAGVVMGILDGLWLSVVAKKFYRSQIGTLLLGKPNMTATVIFYLIYLVGVVVFAVLPADTWLQALGYGALFWVRGIRNIRLNKLVVHKRLYKKTGRRRYALGDISDTHRFGDSFLGRRRFSMTVVLNYQLLVARERARYTAYVST